MIKILNIIPLVSRHLSTTLHIIIKVSSDWYSWFFLGIERFSIENLRVDFADTIDYTVHTTLLQHAQGN